MFSCQGYGAQKGDQEIQELVDFLKVRSVGDVRFATDLVQRVFKRIEQG